MGRRIGVGAPRPLAVVFTEFRFLGFFVAVLVVYWTLPGRWRKGWLLATSYVFYAAWDWRFLSLIWISTLVDYTASLRIDAARTERSRRSWLHLSLAVNLGLLGFFKYYDFFTDGAAEFAGWLGFTVDRPTLEIVLPVGISFYTFQTLSYTIDVYRRRLAPQRSLLDVALFVGFFPQLVAGPIVRAADFLPQLGSPRRFTAVAVRANLALFLVGFFKKAAVSDGIAPVVDAYFADPVAYDAGSAWLAIFLYGIQIYCDFSGYSDMAIASAGLLGFRLPANFAYPYLAPNITAFWRRWHISLSSWLRDYLYIPLGGNRGSRLFTLRNVMLTMLLGGLWHGAAWRFVIWGGLHGLALVGHRLWRERMRPQVPAAARPLAALGGVIVTFLWVNLAWIPFRAEDLERSWIVLRACLLLDAAGSARIAPPLAGLVVLLAGVHLAAFRLRDGAWPTRGPAWLFAAAWGGALALVFALMNVEAEPFIYFQF